MTMIKHNRFILQSKKRIKSKKRNVFTQEINKVLLSADDNKRAQSLYSTETYAYGTSHNT